MILLLCSIFITSNSLFSSVLYDPALEWKTLTTENFYIHYHNEIEQIAAEMTIIAEDVHKELRPKIGWQPAAKTHIVLVDNTDIANGYSTPFPVNTITMFITKPESHSVLNNYRNWLRMLFIHEYTHTLNFDMISGIPEATRSCFGRLWFPSMFQPVWLNEGNAVYHESISEGMGRNNSTYTDMIIRTEILSETFASQGQASGFPRSWPRGDVPYLYGGLFLDYLEKFHGSGSVANIFLENSDNILPYLINKNARDVYGQNFNTLWNEWSQYISAKYLMQAAEIAQKPLTAYKALSDSNNNSRYPRFSRDGKSLYYVSNSPQTETSLVKLDFDTGKNNKLCRVYSPLSLSPGITDTVYLSDVDYYKTFSLYHEAWYYGGKYKKLTKKLRGKYIDVSYDGQETVYVSQENGYFSLVFDTINFDSPKAVISNSDIQITGTRFSPDGRSILFTIKERDALTNLFIFDRDANVFFKLTNNSGNNIEGAWHPNGKKILFSSDRNGIYNIHEYNLSEYNVRQLTNFVSGAFYPDISPDGKNIAFSLYSSNGMLVSLTEYNNNSYNDYNSPMKQVDADFFTPGKSANEYVAENSRPYSPIKSLLPQFFIPLFYSEEIYPDKYDSAIGIMTFGWDVLHRHEYILSAAWFYGVQNKLVIDAAYICSILYPNIIVGYFDDSIFTGKDAFPYKDNTSVITRELTRMGYLTLSFPIRTISSEHSISLTGTYEQKKFNYYNPLPFEYSKTIYLSKARLMYAYSNTDYYTYSISREHGREIILFYDTYNKNVLSDYTFGRAAAQYNEYLPSFFKNHVIALLLRGAAYIDKPDVINSFSLGQYTKGNQDALTDIRDTWGLRGYPAGSANGTRLAAGSFEYRWPILQYDFAFGLLPIMFRDLWITLFADYGDVWNEGSFSIHEFKTSAGIQLHTKFTIGYQYDIIAFGGYARGFASLGEDQFYFGFGTFLPNMFNNSKKRLDYL